MPRDWLYRQEGPKTPPPQRHQLITVSERLQAAHAINGSATTNIPIMTPIDSLSTRTPTKGDGLRNQTEAVSPVSPILRARVPASAQI